MRRWWRRRGRWARANLAFSAKFCCRWRGRDWRRAWCSRSRALGDFGATLILAGNIPGRTQTLPLAIFFAVESGDTADAVRLSVVTVAISLAALGALNLWTRHRRGLAMRVVEQE